MPCARSGRTISHALLSVECMIREISSSDFDEVFRVVNDAAQAYRGIIPDDRWKEPYMSSKELKEEIGDGVKFFGWIIESVIVGVMGIQQVRDITLIRHAYVTPKLQNKDHGGFLQQLRRF